MKGSGFTIVELLVVLAIVAILLLSALPSFDSMVKRNQTTASLNRLVGAINHTRHAAVQYGATTTLCAVKTTGKCGNSWTEDLTVFTDHNRNAWLDEEDEVISIIRSFGSSDSVKWRSFQNRQYLQMTALGYTNFQNGNFVVCPGNGDARLARQIVVNVQGRVRINRSVNEAGHPVDRNKKALRC